VIAQPVRIDLVASGRIDKRIVGRRRVCGARGGMIDVDAQDLAEQHVEVLRVVRRIVARSAVADANVKVVVGAEREHAAVVILVGWMRDCQQDCLGGRGDVGIARDLVFGDDERAVGGSRVVDEEAAVRRVLRMEREAQQAALAAGDDVRADVQENARRGSTRLQNTHDATLLDDEQPV